MDQADSTGAQPNWVRPYTLTAGRTRPSVDLPLEAQIEAVQLAPQRSWQPTDVREEIVTLCVDRPAVAEVAARVDVPVGVARVLVGDLVLSGYLRVLATLNDKSTKKDRRDLIGRTLRGLRAL